MIKSNMLLASRSTGLLLGLFLFGFGFQPGFTQIHTRSFCIEITMPETRLCDVNLPIIEIVEVSQYDFAVEGGPCVYSGRDCGRPIRNDTQLYMDILTHCDGQRTCGGFYITRLPACSRRATDYMVINFRCKRDETATTIGSPRSTKLYSSTNQEADTLTEPVTAPTAPTDPRRTNIGLYAGVAVGGVVAVILVIVVIAVCVKRKKRHTESKQTDTDDGDTPAAHQTNGEQPSSRLHTPGEQPSSRLHTPGENDIILEEIVTDNNANETSPEQPAPDRMTADDPAVIQQDPDLAKKDSPAGNNPVHDDTMHLATPTADTPEAWGYSSVGAAISEPSPSSKEPKYDQHNTHTIPATIQKSVDTSHTTGPDVYATVQKDKPHTSDIQNKASDDTKEPDVYATVQKDRGEDADELVMEDNPLYT